ncbi:MAG: hypothetical protein BMS9Abin10_1098 [Gammaproteobacteria bacterium]|nr:MAG: hypothetical protein BMS9Abin10_1098 [Gammaproteobacteria bacterium]
MTGSPDVAATASKRCTVRCRIALIFREAGPPPRYGASTPGGEPFQG